MATVRRFFLLLVALLPLASTAQTGAGWAPGSRWTYQFFSFGPGSADLYLRYTGDTIIQGRACQKLHRLLQYRNGMPSGPGSELYTAADADRVWVYADGQFYKMYDFGARPGDSWTAPIAIGGVYWCSRNAQVTVDSVGQQLIAGRMRRWFRAHYSLTPAEPGYVARPWGRVYEGLGPVGSFMLIARAYYFPCESSDPFLSGPLLAFDAGGQYRYPNGPALATTPQAPAAQLGLTPNPSTGLLTLQLPPGYTAGAVQVHDLAGRLAWQGPLPARPLLDLRALPKGLYLVRVQQAGQPPLTQRVLLQ